MFTNEKARFHHFSRGLKCSSKVLFSLLHVGLGEKWHLITFNCYTVYTFKCDIMFNFLFTAWWFFLTFLPQDFPWIFKVIWHLYQRILQYMWCRSHKLNLMVRCVTSQQGRTPSSRISTAYLVFTTSPVKTKWYVFRHIHTV